MMKYEPSRVISQMTTKRTRPIEREPPPVYFALPRGALRNFCHSRSGEFKTGRIYHRFLSAQACSCILLFYLLQLLPLPSSRRLKKICIASNLHLTNFFDLSNIRAFAGGPLKNVWGLAMSSKNVFSIRWATGAGS